MDADLVLIFSFILLTLMFVLPMAYFFQKRAAEHEERKLELVARAEEARAAETTGGGNYRKLEERVRVLERIATDGNSALATQIEQLRDLQDLDVLTDTREKA